jgi:hypothetical protein
VGELISKRAAEELHWHEWKQKAKLHGAVNWMRDKPDSLVTDYGDQPNHSFGPRLRPEGTGGDRGED